MITSSCSLTLASPLLVPAGRGAQRARVARPAMIPSGSFDRMARRARRRREEVRRAPPRLQQAVLPRPQWTGSEPAISAAGPTRRCAPARHGSAANCAASLGSGHAGGGKRYGHGFSKPFCQGLSTHGGDSTQVPRTEPASPYLLLQDRGAGAPEGGQMAAFPKGRRRTRSRLSRPMSQRARFDAPRRRFVRRTRATTRRPPVVRSRRCGLRQLHQLMHFRNRRPPGGWGRVAPPAGHGGRRRRRQAPTAGTGRSHNRCAPLAASSPDPIPLQSTTRPRWTTKPRKTEETAYVAEVKTRRRPSVSCRNIDVVLVISCTRARTTMPVGSVGGVGIAELGGIGLGGER